MTYQQLQSILSCYRNLGYTTIALNSSKAALQAEYDRIEAEQAAEYSDDVESTTTTTTTTSASDEIFVNELTVRQERKLVANQILANYLLTGETAT